MTYCIWMLASQIKVHFWTDLSKSIHFCVNFGLGTEKMPAYLIHCNIQLFGEAGNNICFGNSIYPFPLQAGWISFTSLSTEVDDK